MKQLLLFFLLVLSSLGFAQPSKNLRLWYNKPAGTVWENALPIGNGRLGGMIYGNVDKETIQLNEHTVWSGSPNRNDNLDAWASLPQIRQLIFDGKQKDAEKLANKTIITKKSHGQMFQPVGSLNLTFDGHDNYTDYYRDLDIERAVAKTSYTANGVTYTREIFASLPERILVVQLTASKPSALSFRASYTTPQLKPVISANANELTITGTTSDHEGVKGMVKYMGIAKIKTNGGTVAANDTSLTVKEATSATIYISIATN